MNKITSLCTLCLMGILLLFSCQNDDLSSDNIGYLRLQMGVNESTNTKAEEVYNPKQMAVQILRADGTVAEETSNFAAEWQGKQIALHVGSYTLQASSAGFDGQTSGFEKPYYTGKTEFVIEKGKEINATVTCTLANVKVTVNFDKSFQKYFKAATVTVGKNEPEEETAATEPTITPLVFEMGKEQGSGYFPAIDLQAKVEITNQQDATFSQTDAIRDVKPRDHYILNYSVGMGEGSIDIDVDETSHTYTFHINISTTPKTSLAAPTVNAWGKLAYLEGSVISATETLDTDLMKFQYRKKGDADWTDAPTTTYEENPAQGTTPATDEGDLTPKGTFKATLTGLTPETEYECRMVYANEEYSSDATSFTTEAITTLYNGSFDDWYSANGVWYAVAEADYNGGNAYWDSGNKGASLMSKNPTSPEESIVHSTGKSAKLQSQYVGIGGSLGKFAAGNLYTGHFVKTIGTSGAEIQFGSPFTARPIALHGWFRYTAGTVDYYGDSTPGDALVQDGGTDMCAIYIALSDADAPYTVNTRDGNFVDYANDPHIIAYGEIPVSDCVSTGDNWKEFTINLEYRDLTRKPKYIIVVASASKYGDYFTGSTGSVMYIDDFELVYDGQPVVKGQQ